MAQLVSRATAQLTMSNTTNEFVTWQFCLADSTKHALPGVILVRARKNGRGPWTPSPGGLPQYLKDWFCLEERSGTLFVSDYASVAALREACASDDSIRWQKAPVGAAKGLVRLKSPLTTPSSLQAIEGFRIGDGTKWGISDFYEAKEASLRLALAGGMDFTTGWFSSKKEIVSGCVSRSEGVVLCEVCVSDDFDTEGAGRREFKAGRKGVERLMCDITQALDEAFSEAREDQKANSPVHLWSVKNSKGVGIETYLQPCGSSYDEVPPGDNYHQWGWQEEGRVPAKVKRAFERYLGTRSCDDPEFKAHGYTISGSD